MSRTVPKWIKDKKYHFCAVCGKEEDLQYHHWIPSALGGKTEYSNILVVCATCHQKRHNQGGSDHHNYLIKEGITKAKERGVKMGRHPSDHESIIRMIAENSTQFNNINNANYKPMTENEIMEMAGIKPVCYAKCKRQLMSAMQEEVWPYKWEKPKVVKYRPLYDRVIKKMRGDVV
jgi:predicted metal-binding protein